MSADKTGTLSSKVALNLRLDSTAERRMIDAMRQPLGIKLLAAFFLFGASMCALTIVLLVFPGTRLDSLWRLNPEAQATFRSMGRISILLMAVVGSACALAATGLIRRTNWGRALAIAILAINLAGDLANVFVRQDSRTLIGLPIAAALIMYLVKGKRAKTQSDV
jgi:hypothetical protein